MSAVPNNIAPLPSKLDDLVLALIAAKQVEDQATKDRVEIEERIAALHPPKQEGSDTFEAAGMKVTITGALNYKAADLLSIEALAANWSDPSLSPVKVKRELDKTGCKWIRAERPGLWKQLATYVTVTPAKTSISIKV